MSLPMGGPQRLGDGWEPGASPCGMTKWWLGLVTRFLRKLANKSWAWSAFTSFLLQSTALHSSSVRPRCSHSAGKTPAQRGWESSSADSAPQTPCWCVQLTLALLYSQGESQSWLGMWWRSLISLHSTYFYYQSTIKLFDCETSILHCDLNITAVVCVNTVAHQASREVSQIIYPPFTYIFYYSY